MGGRRTTDTIMDDEAAEHAVGVHVPHDVACMDWTRNCTGFARPYGRGAAFLPEVYGTEEKMGGGEVLAKVVVAYMNKVGITARR
ncbi:hypothetical protein ACHAXA_006198 [Cyclostephanos tholiformis]|uniref:Uncharacterized protein n=1 Tax=Cyclostephanos tholiformis TaxID=382380 RepID=A0ABD3RU88_9STRA